MFLKGVFSSNVHHLTFPQQNIFDPKRLGMFSVFFHFFPINKVWRHGAEIFHPKKSNFTTVSLWESTPVTQCCHETIRGGQSYTRDFWKDTPENRHKQMSWVFQGPTHPPKCRVSPKKRSYWGILKVQKWVNGEN